MRTHFEYNNGLRSQRLAALREQAAELERKLSDARASLEDELAQTVFIREASLDQIRGKWSYGPQDAGPGGDTGIRSDLAAGPWSAHGHGDADSSGEAFCADGRTEVLVNHGRRSSYHPRLSLQRKVAIGAAVVAALVTILVLVLTAGGPAWPSSVATVQAEAAKACSNPNVKSEPGQVDFACAKTTRQILWVFALLTSGDNPNFADLKSGRMGLEPIAPAQGGEVGWSLNLHHPYNPASPIDSLEVAARAINNIVGGATLTGASGKPVVQPGLESKPANCVRYTGSAAVTARAGFPGICTRPVTSPAGQAALVADIYQKWIVGAPPQAAQDAAVLFENSTSPGDAQVQAILKHLPDSRLQA